MVIFPWPRFWEGRLILVYIRYTFPNNRIEGEMSVITSVACASSSILTSLAPISIVTERKRPKSADARSGCTHRTNLDEKGATGPPY